MRGEAGGRCEEEKHVERSDVQVCHQNPMGSHCTICMGQVGLSMGVHCPCLVAPYPTVRPIRLYHGTGGTVHGSTLSLSHLTVNPKWTEDFDGKLVHEWWKG